MKRGAVLLIAVGISACATDVPRYSQPFERQVREAANPSTLVAREIAYARAAREDGQWTAMRRYAADGAVVHAGSGPMPVRQFLSIAGANPDVPNQWTPLSVHMSCDGGTAVTRGKYRDAEGGWGYYATVWERDANYDYHFVYDIAAPDAELTERENRAARAPVEDDGSIVVEAVPSIRGIVSECDLADSLPEQFAAAAQQDGGRDRIAVASDDTLAWEWRHAPDGKRGFSAWIIESGAWVEAVRLDADADGRHMPAPRARP